MNWPDPNWMLSKAGITPDHIVVYNQLLLRLT